MKEIYEEDEQSADWTLWSCVLGPPSFWLLQFGVRYALVPWVCKTGHRWVLWAAGVASVVVAAVFFVHALKRWRRLRRYPPPLGDTSSHPFLAVIGFGVAGLFLVAVIVQVVAHGFIDPCVS